MPKVIVDSSTIISTSISSLLWLFEKLHEHRNVDFIVSPSVKEEIIDNAIKSDEHRYEAMRVLRQITMGTFKIYDGELDGVRKLLTAANNSFSAHGEEVEILHEADAEVAMLGKKINADGLAVDERTLRMLIEDPESLKERLERRLHTNVEVNHKYLDRVKKHLEEIPVMRSTELASFCITEGLFDEMIETCGKRDKESREHVIQGVLYALKFSGCAVSFKELHNYFDIFNAEE